MTGPALVTGATGFIGGHLVRRLLAQGRRVNLLVREDSDVAGLPADANLVIHRHTGGTEAMIAIFAQARPAIVFHLASLFLADHKPEEVDALIASNVALGAQLLEAMAATGTRAIVNTGTAWQHFEGDGYRPVNLYAATKQAFEDLIAFYADARGTTAITLKLFDTYGPGDTRRKLIRILVEHARDPGEALAMSPGQQIVDMTHVEDVAEAFLVAGERVSAGAPGMNERYLVSGERLSVQDLVRLLGEAVGGSLAVEFGGRPYRPREVMEPIVPREDDLLPGWRRRHTLAATLPGLIAG